MAVLPIVSRKIYLKITTESALHFFKLINGDRRCVFKFGENGLIKALR